MGKLSTCRYLVIVFEGYTTCTVKECTLDICGDLSTPVPLIVKIIVLLVSKFAHAPMSVRFFFVSGRLPDTDAVSGIFFFGRG